MNTPHSSPVQIDKQGAITVITIMRPQRRNAVDGYTARALFDAFTAFDTDAHASVAILTGAEGHFCAGADLKQLSLGDEDRQWGAGSAHLDTGKGILGSLGPMGPTRMQLSKPVIAAIEGYAVAGGMELALWADLRVMAQDAVMGVFCRRFGVPLIDGGSVRLPRLIGQSRAMDLILTGRSIDAAEALQIGLANRIVPSGQALAAAITLAQQIAAFPQACMRGDRHSALSQWDWSQEEALHAEFQGGLAVIASGETLAGATAFAQGKGRHGDFAAKAP